MSAVMPSARRSVRAAVVGALSASAIMLSACGEREFDTQTLIEDLNAEGAELTLGEPLPTDNEDIEVTALSMAGGGTGSVVTLNGTDEAREEFSRCEAAVSLICFRVSNSVLRFLELDAAGTQQLSVAVSALQTAEP